MARPTRIYIPGVSFHVINRGVNRGAIFREDIDYEWFLALLERAAGRGGTSVHSYTLMGNHFHLIVTPGSAYSLPRTMKEVSRRYTLYYNRKYERIGPLWNGRYRALPILDETYWLTCLRYIEQNPVRARMVARPDDYQWSTYAIHALGRPPGWIVRHDIYLALGADENQRQQAYRGLCAVSLSNAEIVRLEDPAVELDLGSDPNLTPIRHQSDPSLTP